MSSILSRSALLLVYGVALAIGLALIGTAVFWLLRSFTAGRQPSAGAQGWRLGRGAVYSLGLGAAVLGGVGLLALLLLRAEPATSLLAALAAGLLAGLIAALLLIIVPNRQRREEAGLAIAADGREARVIIPIPSSGLGEVVYRDGAETIHLGARSATGQLITAGSRVRIERVAHRVAIVRPLDGNGSAG